jgi:hypothetical protein
MSKPNEGFLRESDALIAAASGPFRWILASLVTLNGGAILALGNWADSLTSPHVQNAFGLFFAGCFFAVLAALMAACLMLVLGAGLRSGELRMASQREEMSGRSPKRLQILVAGAVIFSVASLSLFGLGGLHAGLAIKTSAAMSNAIDK